MKLMFWARVRRRAPSRGLSGSTDNVTILDTIVEEVGDNPQNWLPIFKEKMLTN